jgi:hypothetical protein
MAKSESGFEVRGINHLALVSSSRHDRQARSIRCARRVGPDSAGKPVPPR